MKATAPGEGEEELAVSLRAANRAVERETAPPSRTFSQETQCPRHERLLTSCLPFSMNPTRRSS